MKLSALLIGLKATALTVGLFVFFLVLWGVVAPACFLWLQENTTDAGIVIALCVVVLPLPVIYFYQEL